MLVGLASSQLKLMSNIPIATNHNATAAALNAQIKFSDLVYFRSIKTQAAVVIGKIPINPMAVL